MFSENIVLALIVAATTGITTTIAPVTMALITARQARKDRQEDYARQDAVAARAATVARKLSDATSTSNIKLDAIHTLVNSNMTAALQAEHDAMVREAAMMQEVIDLKRAAGQEPNELAVAAQMATNQRIAELESVLATRQKPQE